jgi:hypothetical protein
MKKPAREAAQGAPFLDDTRHAKINLLPAISVDRRAPCI